MTLAWSWQKNLSNQQADEQLKGFDWIPKCYKARPDGLCYGEFSNNYWSYKKCRFCFLFSIEWCGTCKWRRFHGPHMACHCPKLFGGEQNYQRGKWLSHGSSEVAWMTKKEDCEKNPKHACREYERG